MILNYLWRITSELRMINDRGMAGSVLGELGIGVDGVGDCR